MRDIGVVSYSGSIAIIRANMQSIVRDFISTGYHLRALSDEGLYREGGYKDIFELAHAEFGFSPSWTSRCMRVNERFSKGGYSYILAEEYREYDKSKLTEMLPLTEAQIREIPPEATVQEIKEYKRVLKQAEVVKDNPDADDFATSQKEETVFPMPEPMYSVEEKEIVHFTKEHTIDSAYGAQRAKIVRSYLEKLHESGWIPCDRITEELEFMAWGSKYRAWTEGDVVCFQDDNGTFMDVEIERLQKEYEFFYPEEETIIEVEAGAAEEEEVEAAACLPTLKNNDQRKAFIDAYTAWPLWIETRETGERYYRYDLTDGTSIVVKVYHSMLFDHSKTVRRWEDRFTEGWGREEYYLLKEGKFFRDCETNRSALVDHLKELQKGDKNGKEQSQ
jgi:hypothetical protein|nr:MAG TPA: Protein of unknown function (DUF3102) [Caudoviricetes sp.]